MTHGEQPHLAESDQLIAAAQRIAEAILRGEVSPYEGGKRIWRECHLKLQRGDHRLDPFAYWSSEFEETSERKRRALCDRALKEAASLLVQNGSAL